MSIGKTTVLEIFLIWRTYFEGKIFTSNHLSLSRSFSSSKLPHLILGNQRIRFLLSSVVNNYWISEFFLEIIPEEDHSQWRRIKSEYLGSRIKGLYYVFPLLKSWYSWSIFLYGPRLRENQMSTHTDNAIAYLRGVIWFTLVRESNSFGNSVLILQYKA